jgi:hypothetical protein
MGRLFDPKFWGTLFVLAVLGYMAVTDPHGFGGLIHGIWSLVPKTAHAVMLVISGL